MIQELDNVALMRSFFGPCHVTFLYLELLTFFGKFVQGVVICFFFRFIFSKNDSTDGSCNVTNDCRFSYNLFKKSLFTSANTYKKYIVSKGYSIAHHDDEMWCLLNCRFHVLLGNTEELLLKLDLLCFTYQHVDCLYTPFKNRSGGNIVVKSAQVLDIV